MAASQASAVLHETNPDAVQHQQQIRQICGARHVTMDRTILKWLAWKTLCKNCMLFSIT